MKLEKEERKRLEFVAFKLKEQIYSFFFFRKFRYYKEYLNDSLRFFFTLWSLTVIKIGPVDNF